MIYKFRQWVVTEYELYRKITPPSYQLVMKKRLIQFMGVNRYVLYCYAAGIDSVTMERK